MDIQSVLLEQLIAGALLKFDELDNFDISLLISRYVSYKKLYKSI